MSIKLVKTCDGCPEQYDAFINGLQIGYIRCRWGEIAVKCPDANGKVVYQSITDGYGALTDDERGVQLSACIKAIESWNKRQQEQYLAMTNVVNALDNTVSVIYDTLYGCGINDNQLERLAELMDKISQECQDKYNV